MPTYAYVCTACDHSFEAVQAITDEPLSECPSCGGTLRKKFHPVGVAFKGSGFYRTDSRGGSAEGSKSPAGSTTDGASSSGSSTSSSESSSSSPSTSSGSTSGSGTSTAGAASS